MSLWTTGCEHRFYIAIHQVSLLSHAACAIAIRTGGVRRLVVANGPNIFQMLLVLLIHRPNVRYRPIGVQHVGKQKAAGLLLFRSGFSTAN